MFKLTLKILFIFLALPSFNETVGYTKRGVLVGNSSAEDPLMVNGALLDMLSALSISNAPSPTFVSLVPCPSSLTVN